MVFKDLKKGDRVSFGEIWVFLKLLENSYGEQVLDDWLDENFEVVTHPTLFLVKR